MVVQRVCENERVKIVSRNATSNRFITRNLALLGCLYHKLSDTNDRIELFEYFLSTSNTMRNNFSIPLRLLFITFILFFVGLNHAHYYGPLIKDVTNKDKIIQVIIASGANYPSNIHIFFSFLN